MADDDLAWPEANELPQGKDDLAWPDADELPKGGMDEVANDDAEAMVEEKVEQQEAEADDGVFVKPAPRIPPKPTEPFHEWPKWLQLLEPLRAINRERALRFGTDYVEPDPRQVQISPAELKRLEAEYRAKKAGTLFRMGMDITSTEEQEKMKRRAEKFGAPLMTIEAQQNRARLFQIGAPEGVDAEEELRRRRERARKFGVPFALEQKLIAEVSAALKEETAHIGQPLRGETLHLFGPAERGLHPICTETVLAHYKHFGAEWVEWIDEKRCNVVFGNAEKAQRALSMTTETFSDDVFKGLEEIARKEAERNAAVEAAAKIAAEKEAHQAALVAAATEAATAYEANPEDEALKVAHEQAAAAVEQLSEAAAASVREEGFDDVAPPMKMEEIVLPNFTWDRAPAELWRKPLTPLVKVKKDDYGDVGATVQFLVRMAATSDMKKKKEHWSLTKNPSKKRRRRKSHGGNPRGGRNKNGYHPYARERDERRAGRDRNNRHRDDRENNGERNDDYGGYGGYGADDYEGDGRGGGAMRRKRRRRKERRENVDGRSVHEKLGSGLSSGR